ncbi:MAG: tyrosyl-tRNA synthetase [Vezdaea aestivalis]|nr:MAG: tyrosyl-tRNA synthetase [Vezdaea aestivalis]
MFRFGRPSGDICALCRLSILRSRFKRNVHASTLRRKAGEEVQWQEKAQRIRDGKEQSMLTLLEQRGYINQITGDRDSVDKLLTSKRIGAYVGVDPTANSLHVGHLVPLMALFWMYVNGYRTNILVRLFSLVVLSNLLTLEQLGGATAKVGDPSGRLTTRDSVTPTDRKVMMVSMHWQLKALWANLESYGRKYGYTFDISNVRGLHNNSYWLGKLKTMDMLREIGPAFRIGWMLSRDSVKAKMENGDGLSLSEFLYPVLQAWDWLHMYRTQEIQMQIGGSDQFGNIVTGMEAVKWALKNETQPKDRIDADERPDMAPVGFTTPLLTTSGGEKLGKSAGNAVWLDRGHTSSFELYQHFVRIPDADVARYLKLLTFMPLSDVEQLVAEHAKDPSRRIAQHRLAQDVLELVHGPSEALEAQAQHRFLFKSSSSIGLDPKNIKSAQAATLAAIGDPDNDRPGHVNVTNLPAGLQTFLPLSCVKGVSITRVLFSAGLVVSASEGHRVVNRGGAYVGAKSDGLKRMGDDVSFTPIKNPNPDKTWEYVIDDSLLVLRVGKWKVKIVRIISDEEYESRGLDCPGWKVDEKEQAVKERRRAELEEMNAREEERAKRRRESLLGPD